LDTIAGLSSGLFFRKRKARRDIPKIEVEGDE
jgi:hypothetical protein